MAIRTKGTGTGVDLTTKSSAPAPPMLVAAAQEMPVGQLAILDNPGRLDNDNKIEEVKHGIEVHGMRIIEPLVIRVIDPERDGEAGVAAQAKGATHAVVAGRRRLRAAKNLGMKTVPVVLHTGKMSPVATAILENIGRRSLSAIEINRSIIDYANEHAMDVHPPKAGDTSKGAYGKDIGKLIKFMGLDQATIYRHLRLSLLDEDVQRKVHNKVVSAEAAKDIGDLLARGLLSSDAAKVVLEIAEENVKASANGTPRPDSRTPDQIKLDKENAKQKKAKKKKRLAGAGSGVGKSEVRDAAATAAASGRITAKDAEAIAAQTSKGGRANTAPVTVSKMEARAIKLVKHCDGPLMQLKNVNIARLAAGISRYMEGEIGETELTELFKKSCKEAE